MLASCRARSATIFRSCCGFRNGSSGTIRHAWLAAPEELSQFLAPLAAAGVDIFHCSTRRFREPEFEGSSLNLAGWVKRSSNKPAITVGLVGLDNDMFSAFRGEGSGVAFIDQLIDMLKRDEFDLVAVGRALLVDPAWAAKVREGRTDQLLPFSSEALKTLS